MAQQLANLVIGGLRKVLIPSADRGKVRGRAEADDVVDLVLESGGRCRRRPQARPRRWLWMILPESLDRRAHRRAGGQPVVNQNRPHDREGREADGCRDTPEGAAASSIPSRSATARMTCGGMLYAVTTSPLSTSVPLPAMAPMASSGCHGTPSLRTTNTSSGAFSSRAIS